MSSTRSLFDPQLVGLAVKFLEARETMHRLFGDSYGRHVEEYRNGLRRLMAARKMDVLSAALLLAKKFVAEGYDDAIPLVLAAAADLIDGGASC